MLTMDTHPVYKQLVDHPSDLYAVEVDDRELELIMARETHDFQGTVGAVRVVRDAPVTCLTEQVAKGTLTSRVYSLMDTVQWSTSPGEFQAAVINHPAFPLIRDTVRLAHAENTLTETFDAIEMTGAMVTFDRYRGIVTLGLNESTMRAAIKEYTPLTDHINGDLIKRLNGPAMNVVWQAFDDSSSEGSEKVEMSTSYFVSFAV